MNKTEGGEWKKVSFRINFKIKGLGSKTSWYHPLGKHCTYTCICAHVIVDEK